MIHNIRLIALSYEELYEQKIYYALAKADLWKNITWMFIVYAWIYFIFFLITVPMGLYKGIKYRHLIVFAGFVFTLILILVSHGRWYHWTNIYLGK